MKRARTILVHKEQEATGSELKLGFFSQEFSVGGDKVSRP